MGNREYAVQILDSVVSMQLGYEWRTDDGVVHVFQRELALGTRNPLNITISSFDQARETVGSPRSHAKRRFSVALVLPAFIPLMWSLRRVDAHVCEAGLHAWRQRSTLAVAHAFSVRPSVAQGSRLPP